MLLMLPALVLLVAAYVPSRIRTAVRHPMLASVKLWAFAHLLTNGDLASVLLFGSFLAYGVYDRISVRHRVALGPLGTASGGMAQDAIAIVAKRGFSGHLVGPKAIDNLDDLRAEIRRTRQLGYGTQHEESEPGLAAIAMLVRDRLRGNAVLGAVSIGGPSFRIDRQRLEGFVEPLKAAVEEIATIWPHATA